MPGNIPGFWSDLRMYDLLDRRTVLAALACSAITARAPAQAASLWPSKYNLTSNRVAALFERLHVPLPDIRVTGKNGDFSLRKLRGKTRLVSLWAEWCAPCLVEARDLSTIQRKLGNQNFEVISLLSGSMKRLDYQAADNILIKNGAPGLTLIVEPNGGKEAATRLSTGGAGIDLPCVVLVDRNGFVRARTTGMPPLIRPKPETGATAKELSTADKQALLSSGEKTLWASADATSFIKSLRDGLLDHS